MASEDQKIQKIADFSKSVLERGSGHDFDHVDRVRRWSLLIARQEGYSRLDLIEAAALLHDIGRPECDRDHSKNHGFIGAEKAKLFLDKNKLFSEQEIEEICLAIKYHNSDRLNLNRIQTILMDADKMDAMGPVLIVRASIAMANKPICDEDNVLGSLWGKNIIEINDIIKEGKYQAATVVDDLNFAYATYDHFSTKTAREMAKPYRDFIKKFLLLMDAQLAPIRDIK